MVFNYRVNLPATTTAAAAVTTATATTAATTVTATATTAAVFARTCFVDVEVATFKVLAVQFFDRLLTAFVVHGDERKAARDRFHGR